MSIMYANNSVPHTETERIFCQIIRPSDYPL